MCQKVELMKPRYVLSVNPKETFNNTISRLKIGMAYLYIRG